jgi:hypothetical protein
MNNIVDEYITNIINIEDDVVKRYEYNLEVIKQTEDETQDLLHEIELSHAKDMYSGYILYKQLKDARQRRRIAKDENELLSDFYNFCKNQVNTKNQLNKILGNSRKTHEKLCNRHYKPRVRDDLTITEIKPQIKSFESMLKDYKSEFKNRNRFKYA